MDGRLVKTKARSTMLASRDTATRTARAMVSFGLGCTVYRIKDLDLGWGEERCTLYKTNSNCYKEGHPSLPEKMLQQRLLSANRNTHCIRLTSQEFVVAVEVFTRPLSTSQTSQPLLLPSAAHFTQLSTYHSVFCTLLSWSNVCIGLLTDEF